MLHLSLSFLGPFFVSCDGETVTAFESLKVRALLAYLAVEADRPHSREALAGLLWPELPDRAARHNLRHVLANLRLAIRDHEANPPQLLITRETIQFNPAGDHDLDVAGLQHLPRLASAAQLEQAVALYRGPFLEGFSLADSPAFEEWLLLRREQFGRLVSSALQRLAAAYEGHGDYERAAACAQRQVELEPWDEQAHRQLMRALALGGRRDQALAQYERCRRTLAEELGIEPCAETVGLYERIREGTLPSPGPSPPAPAFLRQPEEPGEREAPAVVAREAELAKLGQFLAGALAGEGRVVFVAGDAGSGKTVLVREFARRAMEAYADLLVAQGNGNAYTGTGDPYLPFIEALQMLTGDVEGRWAGGGVSRQHALRLWRGMPAAAEALAAEGPDLIGRFMPLQALAARGRAYANWQGHGEVAPWAAQLEGWARPLGQPAAQADLCEQYTRVLQALARRSPLLVLLDDLQWADAGSLSLLFHLGRKLVGSRILLVGAYRPGDVAQGRDGQPHPLVPVVNEFRRLCGDITIDLAEAEGREFVEGLLESEPNRLDGAFRDALYRHTGGQALFTVELLRGLQERGDLVRDRGGCWVVGETLDWERLPARVEAVIAEHMRRLPSRWRALLAAASVEGESFTAEVVARVAGWEAAEALERLSGELARQHRLVTATSCRRVGGRLVSEYRFRHYLFQKYLYSHLDEVERAHLHEAVGAALEGLYCGQAEELAQTAPQLARHFEAAGDLERAVRYLQAAGERAVRLSANLEAIEHLNRALALLARLPETPERARQELAIVLELTGPLVATQGYATPESEWALARAVELAVDRQLGDSLQVVQALGNLANHYGVRGDFAGAVALFRRLAGLTEPLQDAVAALMSHAGLGYALTMSGEFAAALPYLEDVASQYDPALHRSLAFIMWVDMGVVAHNYLAWSHWFLGHPDQAVVHLREALSLAEASEHAPTLSYAGHLAGCLLNLFNRDIPAARRHLEAELALTAEQGLSHWGAGAMALDGWLWAEEGRVEEGVERMREGLAAWQASGSRTLMSYYYSLLARACRRAGKDEEALALLGQGLEMVEQTGERFWEAELHRLRGELLAESAPDQAEACLRRALAVARGQQARMLELRAAVSLGRYLAQRGRREEARALVAGIYGWFTEGFGTPDLQEAKGLLEKLGCEGGPSPGRGRS